MNKDVIDKAFAALIAQRAVNKQLGISATNLQQLRHKLKTGSSISTDLKLKLLQRSGWRQDAVEFTRQDLVSALKFYERTGAAAKSLGVEYVLEKWKAQRK